MAILMTAEVPGMTQEMVDGMTEQLMEQQTAQRGFILHANGSIDGGWGVTEVWEAQQNLTPGTRARSSRTCRRGSNRGSRPANCTTSCSPSRWPHGSIRARHRVARSDATRLASPRQSLQGEQ
jgi:hypothetical protein